MTIMPQRNEPFGSRTERAWSLSIRCGTPLCLGSLPDMKMRKRFAVAVIWKPWSLSTFIRSSLKVRFWLTKEPLFKSHAHFKVERRHKTLYGSIQSVWVHQEGNSFVEEDVTWLSGEACGLCFATVLQINGILVQHDLIAHNGLYFLHVIPKYPDLSKHSPIQGNTSLYRSNWGGPSGTVWAPPPKCFWQCLQSANSSH